MELFWSHSSWLERLGRRSLRYLPEWNYITLHYTYFIVTGLISGIIFWASSTPAKSVRFIDALFLCVSAMTEAGLNTVNLSTLNTWQQAMLFLLIIMGSAIFVSIFVVWVRARAFERVFQDIIQKRRQEQRLKRTGYGTVRVQSLLSLKKIRTDQNERALRKQQLHPDTAPALVTSSPPIQEEGKGDEAAISDEEAVISDDIGLERPHIKFDVQQDRTNGPVNPVEYHESLQPSARLAATAMPILSQNSSPMQYPYQPQLEDLSNVATQQTQVSNNIESRHVNDFNPGINNSKVRRRLLSMSGVGASPPGPLQHRVLGIQRLPTHASTSPSMYLPRRSTEPYVKSSGFISRNSHFHGLTWAEREQLGGYEYRAILFLSFLVPLYFVLWQLLGAISIGAWVAGHRPDTTRENGINPFWTGAFNAISAFNNSGMSLLDANMVAFQDSAFLLLSMGLFILAGNTAYPIFLRMAIWAMWKVLPDDEHWGDDKKTLRFLLDHPRRCYTNLFPRKHTWWLGLSILCLNGIDWAAFEILNIGNHQITVLGKGTEVLDGLFQALAVRSGGFYVVPISSIRISLQVLYVFMMYISAYPVVISMRNSNVYEERSLGIFTDDADTMSVYTPEEPNRQQPSKLNFLGRALTRMHGGIPMEERLNRYFVKHQLRAQLAHDAWWLALAIFLIMIIEGGQFETDPTVFSVFNVIFEIVSAYGCVGISVGVPWAAYSFCGAWHTLSKLILIAVMIRGRHRGLPVAIDHAVQLPGWKPGVLESEEAHLVKPRSDD